MTKIRFAIPFAFATALLLSACGDKNENANEDVLAQDSSLARDLEMANKDTAAQPQLQDVPVTPPPAPAPVQPAPQPAPRRVATTPRRTTPAPTSSNVTSSGNTVSNRSGGGERMGTIASGSTLSFSSGQKICTNTNAVGDRFTATVAETVTGSNGAVIPAGASAIVEVTNVKRSTSSNDKEIILGLAVRSVSFGGKTYNVNGDITSSDVVRVRGTDNKDAQKVATGAVIGAIAGQILGKKAKSTVIGGAVGAGAGAIAAAASANYDGCLNPGARFSIRLNSAMTVQSAS